MFFFIIRIILIYLIVFVMPVIINSHINNLKIRIPVLFAAIAGAFYLLYPVLKGDYNSMYEAGFQDLVGSYFWAVASFVIYYIGIFLINEKLIWLKTAGYTLSSLMVLAFTFSVIGILFYGM